MDPSIHQKMKSSNENIALKHTCNNGSKVVHVNVSGEPHKEHEADMQLS